MSERYELTYRPDGSWRIYDSANDAYMIDGSVARLLNEQQARIEALENALSKQEHEPTCRIHWNTATTMFPRCDCWKRILND